MTITVTPTELEQLNTLRKMEKTFPSETALFKDRKLQWWKDLRAKYNIPADAKLKLGVESGTLLDSRTGEPYKLEARRKRYALISARDVSDAIDAWVDDNGPIDDDENDDIVDERNLPSTRLLHPGSTMLIDASNNVYVEL